jgi:hypothetical protein
MQASVLRGVAAGNRAWLAVRTIIAAETPNICRGTFATIHWMHIHGSAAVTRSSHLSADMRAAAFGPYPDPNSHQEQLDGQNAYHKVADYCVRSGLGRSVCWTSGHVLQHADAPLAMPIRQGMMATFEDSTTRTTCFFEGTRAESSVNLLLVVSGL